MGQVSGLVCFPSEPPLPPMTLYFEETTSHSVTTFPHTDGTGTYQVQLPPGQYIAYAWRDGSSLGGSYSQAVPCGLSVSCTDHSLIPFDVSAGSSVSGIDICDWYGGPDAVPTPVGATPVPPTVTPPAPSGGVSLNCDGTYQRVRITDGGASGKTISVDNWDGGAWVNAWNLAGGDPMVRQMTDAAGYYTFGECQKLVIVPFQHSNPQLWFELGIYEWNGAGMTSVYFNEGYYGEWQKTGDTISFKEASKLGTIGDGPLGPCEWTTLEHTWDGMSFNQTGSSIDPIPGCTVTVP